MVDSGAHSTTEGILESYELSPLQQGMLFHSLDSHAFGVDIEQIICTLNEVLDVPRLSAAWRHVVARHPILRTSFRWEGLSEPLQDIHAHVELPIVQLNWRELPTEELERRWSDFLAEDRRRGFDLAHVPLLRLALVRCAEHEYRLLWTFHHILLDGRSFPLVLREVFAFYEAFRNDQTLQLSLPRPYRDYITWLQGRDLTQAEWYWRQTLQGFRAPTQFTIPRPPEGEERTAQRQGVRETRLSRQTTARLQTFAQDHDLTVHTLLQGAWALLLHHYSGEEDVVFGSTRACRRTALVDADSMVGLFINTLPMRVQTPPQARLIDWLLELRAQQIALRAYEHTPLVKVQGWSEVPRGAPLFESLVVFENYLLDTALRSPGGEWRNRKFQYIGQTNYPLTLVAYADAELLLRIEYDRCRFDDAVSERMLGHLSTLLEGMIVAPDQQLWEVPLISQEEERLFLSHWNQEKASYPSSKCLHQQFEDQAARTPHAIAVVCENQRLTYEEVNGYANRLARKLEALKVGPNVLVGICVERSLDMVVGILGILKAGGAYVPLDPSYPKDRLAFMIEDSGISVVIAQKQALVGVTPHGATILDLDTTALEVTDQDSQFTANLDSGATPDDLAYMIYTSGSTGRPKGVTISHHNVMRLFHATDAWFHFNPHDVWTLFHSYAFDFSVWELWGALLYGGRLVVVPYLVSRSPEAFAALLQTEGVTVLNQTPSAFRQLMPIIMAATPPEKMVLRFVIFGGEALEIQSLRPWFDCYGDKQPQLINMYGITETTVHVTYRPLTVADVQAGTGSVIGRPIPDLHIYVLNQHRHFVPTGVPGEMYVGGAGVARGYWQRPELTRERFIPDPFSDSEKAVLYKSGDLARWLPNGELEYLGRIDQQVKIRGFRIELGEIEAILSQQPAIRETTVLVREDNPGDKRLVAYVATEENIILDDLRSQLREMLPEYMIPAAFVRLDSLPLTPNGKVDRRALPLPDQARPELRQHYVAPRTAEEETLSQIWSVVLGVKRVGVHDNFFELGGDSILSIQVIAKARQAGFQISPKDLFKYPTVASLTANVQTTVVSQSEIGQAQGAAPLSPIQHWFFEQHLPDPHHWNQSFLFETPADMNLAILDEALNVVVRHHDALRLRFKQGFSGWEQYYVKDAERCTIAQIDFSTLSPLEQAAALSQAATELQATLDLTQGPLIRAAHFQLGSTTAGRLLLILHHLVVDGVSWRVLMEDLETAYRALFAKKTIALPTRTTSFQTWAHHLHEYAKQPRLREEFAYWRHVSGGSSTLIPIDLSLSQGNFESAARTVSVSLSQDETRALLQIVPKTYWAQINEILLTALGQSFHTWIGTTDLLVDVEGHGREDIAETIDLSRSMGWFTTIFPVRLNLLSTEQLEESLKKVKQHVRQMPQRGLGYGVLRYLSENPVERETLRSLPQASVSFNYLGQFDQVLAGSTLFRFARESCGPWHSPRGERRYLLEVLALVSQGRFEAQWTYNQHIHHRETVEGLAHRFLLALRAMIARRERADSHSAIPLDFPLTPIDQTALDQLMLRYKRIDDLYPLSPMQRLFYSMEAARSQLGFEQWRFTLHGPLNVEAFKQAWQCIVERHPILRTAFLSEGLLEPLQVVLPQVSLPWLEYDWRMLSPAVQKETLTDTLAEDQRQGFDLAHPPLMRLTLCRMAEEVYHCLWSTHHLLIDGWSWPVIFTELSALYEMIQDGVEVQQSNAPAYRDYIAWLQARQEHEAEAFWRQELLGVTAPTALEVGDRHHRPTNGQGTLAEEELWISEEAAAALRALARTHQLTLNTFLQGAWALLLHRYSGKTDILFGAAFSGRPPEVPGIELMVGPCISNLPIRASIHPEEPLVKWLQSLQEKQILASQYQYNSLQQIQGWSQIPWRYRLFESLLVFQNYVVGDAIRRLGSAVEIRTVAAPEATNYPITLMVVPDVTMQLKILYRREEFPSEQIRRVLKDLHTLLVTMPASLFLPLSESLQALPESPQAKRINSPIHQEKQTPHLQRVDRVPQTTMERVVMQTWKDLCLAEQVGLDDNFFELGGHSLLLVQMHGKLQTSLTRTFPIVALFQYPTIRLLARYLSQEIDEKPASQDFQNRAKRQQAAMAQQKRLSRRT